MTSSKTRNKKGATTKSAREGKKEFLESRISWKWFERRSKKRNSEFMMSDTNDLLLEILKELQFMNDKK